ncbi:GTP pyrophosphokinase [Alteribacter lacisalsi]|jgi:putative GTP pyrophosphokinase|uniref:GTP diphosphokinase n=1 Tax=Alteribacter lacisalsi TaxID=2045244 RepID=A0A2W0H9D2_9BACI|nr:GTP pyrophosphokinase family protein [Alteribacter lacisalsi]PYZ97737.1 GTP pyrophosphokinase [Alteribacter lacisalsi]
MKEWDELLAPYKQAVDELKVKFKGIREQYRHSPRHTPIEFVTGRVKPVSSILQKAKRKAIPIDQVEGNITDIAGIRIMCQFVGDIDTVVELIKIRNDFRIVDEIDYIKHKKESGYRSYHMVLEYPVQTIDGEHPVLVELQIRTLAMNFWATIEHSLQYKYSGQIPSHIEARLHRAAEAAFRLDEEMSQIRGEVREAQKIISTTTDPINKPNG